MKNDKEAYSAFNLSIFQYFNIFIFLGRRINRLSFLLEKFKPQIPNLKVAGWYHLHLLRNCASALHFPRLSTIDPNLWGRGDSIWLKAFWSLLALDFMANRNRGFEWSLACLIIFLLIKKNLERISKPSRRQAHANSVLLKIEHWIIIAFSNFEKTKIVS